MKETIRFKLNGRPLSMSVDDDRCFYGYYAQILALPEQNSAAVRAFVALALFS